MQLFNVHRDVCRRRRKCWRLGRY